MREQFAICGEIENVRIVRDKKFRLGKGFGYVLFKVVSFSSKNLPLVYWSQKCVRLVDCLILILTTTKRQLFI